MTNGFLIYFAVILSILFLPERFWDYWWGKWRFLPQSKGLFFKEKSAGEKLLQLLPELELNIALGKSVGIKLPEYKFFTELIDALLESNRRLGIGIKVVLLEVRRNLVVDLQFERKFIDQTIEANAQFVVIGATTWLFIFFSSQLADLPLDYSVLFFIVLIQISGLFVFNWLLSQLKRRTFGSYDQVISRLYFFAALSELGLSFSQVLKDSRVLDEENWKNRLFMPCATRLSDLIERWKANGVSPAAGAREIIQELWHLKEVSFARFLKHLELLKFTVLSAFFLPAYFLYLYSIFQFFMEQ